MTRPKLLPALLCLSLTWLAGCREDAPGTSVDCADRGQASLGTITVRDCEAELSRTFPATRLPSPSRPGRRGEAHANVDRSTVEAGARWTALRAELEGSCTRANRCELPDADYRARRDRLAGIARDLLGLTRTAAGGSGPEALAGREALARLLATDDARPQPLDGGYVPAACPASAPLDCHDGSCAPPGASCCGEGRSCGAGALCCGASCCPPDATCRPDGSCEGGSFALACGGDFPQRCPDGSCAPAGAACCADGAFCDAGACCQGSCCGEGEVCMGSGGCGTASDLEGPSPFPVTPAFVAPSESCRDEAYPLECPDGTCGPIGAICCNNGKWCAGGRGCCGASDCCAPGQACVEGSCVGPVDPSPACRDPDFPQTCPDGSCTPGGAACCGGGKFCPAKLACCGEKECCLPGEACVAGACVAGRGPVGVFATGEEACVGDYPMRCEDGTCAPEAADCCDNGKFCREGACCGADDCCGAGERCLEARCVATGAVTGEAADATCEPEAPMRCPDGTCAPVEADCCMNGKFCRKGSCCGEEDCCTEGQLCVEGRCLSGS